ncbi:MAG: hypothetical protein R2860_10210 [Desulfobacterales bacterium]
MTRSTPWSLVNGLRKGYPDAHLTWVLQTLSHDMVKHQKNDDRFITFSRNGALRDWLDLFRRLPARRLRPGDLPRSVPGQPDYLVYKIEKQTRF